MHPKKLCPKRGSSLWFLEQHRIPDQWLSRSNGLPDCAWFCLICLKMPENAWKCLKRAWFCLKLPEIAWFCLKLPDFVWNCPKWRLNPCRQAKTNHNDMETWKWLILFGIVWECWKGVCPWATFLPRPLGFSIMGKQTLIMNVEIWFLLFEGLSFCFGESERVC